MEGKSADVGLSAPITGSAERCCAYAATGHAAAPPSAAKNSRRRRLICPSCAGEPYPGRIAQREPVGLPHRMLHCGISAPSADGFMAEMGHKPAYLSPRRPTACPQYPR